MGTGAYRNSKILANVTNGADATYYYYLDLREYSLATFQCTLSGGSGTVTLTVEGTCQEGADNTALTYQDVTNDLFGVASITATDLFILNGTAAFNYLRVKVVASTGDADDADWRIDVCVKN